MPNHIARHWKLAAGAAWVLSASAAMADTPIQLQTITPTIWTGGSNAISMQEGYNASTLTLNSPLIYATAPYGVATHPMDGAFSNPNLDNRFVTPNAYSIVDAPGNVVYEIGSQGGVTFTTPTVSPYYQGGTLTVTDLAVNFGTKVISATLIGSNGVNTVQNVPLWTVGNISSVVLSCPDNGGMCDAGGFGAPQQPEHRLNTTSTGLHLTEQGVQAFYQALGIQEPYLASMDFGTLQTTTMFLSGAELRVVPEPGTWMLMGLGLIGLFGIRRRHAHMRPSA